MKKYQRIIVGVCSLLLSVSMLVFGVFAATSVNYTLGGTISFEVGEPYGSIYLESVYGGTMANGLNIYSSTVDTNNITYGGVNLVAGQDYGVTALGNGVTTKNATLNYTFTEESAVVYKYTFAIKTLNTSDIAIQVTTGNDVPASNKVGEKVVFESLDTITKDDGIVYVTYYLFLLDLSVNVASINYSVNVKLNFVEELTAGWSNPNDYLEP